jgi:tagatose 6-phosphate kinase
MIVVVGLTPTVQRTLRFAGPLEPGEVNRAVETWVTASGKGANVARVLATLGGGVRLIHPLGGDSGRFVARTLDADGVPQAAVWVGDDRPTRTCTTLLAGDGVTELVEEAPPLTDDAIAGLWQCVERHLPTASALALCGSLPPGVAPDFTAECVARANGYGVPTLLDAQKEPLRRALGRGPWLVKPNRQEAAAALGLPLTDDPLADAARLGTALLGAGAQNALVSAGRAGAVLVEASGARHTIAPPAIDAVNPIGSGDSLAAGLLCGVFVERFPLVDAVVLGTACAAANCLSLTSGVVDPTDVVRLRGQVVVRATPARGEVKGGRIPQGNRPRVVP